MRAIAVNCPNCAAKLNVGETARTAVCNYCGTTSRIQARTRFLERAVAPPVLPPQERSLPIATQPHSTRWGVGVILLPLVLLGGIGTAVVASIGGGLFDKDRLWQSPGVLVADVTGDGLDDIVGWVQAVPGEDCAIAAFAGTSGKRLWERTLGTYQETGWGMLAHAGDLILYADPRGRVQALGAANGAPRWKAALGEQAEAFCAGEGAALVKTRDERWHRIELASGNHQVAEEPLSCRPLASDRGLPRNPRGFDYQPGIESHDPAAPREIDGMRVSKAVKLAESEVWLALGHKHPGTRVPMLARYQVLHDQGGLEFAVPWALEVPGADALRAKEGAPEHIAAAEGRVYVAYAMAEGPPRVAGFDLDSGARLFEVALPSGRTRGSLSHLAATGSRVFVKDGCIRTESCCESSSGSDVRRGHEWSLEHTQRVRRTPNPALTTASTSHIPSLARLQMQLCTELRLRACH
jgi:hypothetical protein